MKASRSLCAVLLVGVCFFGVRRASAAAPPAIDRARLAALLLQLDDDNFDKREYADRALRASGKMLLPLLEGEKERNPSPEVRNRLEGIIRELTADEHVPELVRLLAETEPEVRDLADWELRRYGKVVLPLLRKEQKVASSEEVRRRLEQIITELSPAR